MKAKWSGLVGGQGVFDRAGGTCTTPADCGLVGEVLWEEQGVVDRAAGTSTTPADCGLGGEVLWEEQGVVDRAGVHLYNTCRLWARW